jgi:acyl-CoA reductase-like NAD-dependent aldehyde dehydrogenase
MAKESSQKYQQLIDGQWVPSAHYAPNINPSDLTDIIGNYAQADAAQLDSAVDAARRAFPSWSHTGIQARSDALDRIGSEILARKESLGILLAREEGKTKAEGIAEAARAGNIFKFFAGECLRSTGDLVSSVRPGVGVEVTREPLGVVGLITPWNFPLAIPAWKIAPALAFGNCVVFKPAELVPASAWALSEIIHRSGIAGGVFNLVMGQGRDVGQRLIEHRDVDAVSFTGSQAVGHRVAIACAAHLKKCQLEMGGKNAQVVLDDADLAPTVELCVQSAFYATGQRCTAASRLVVTEGIYPQFVRAMHDRMMGLKVGNALGSDTDIGPVASQAQFEKDISYIELGRQEQAVLVCGGAALQLSEFGYYLTPALFTNTTPDMRINREEIFGPVASIIRVRDYEEALAVTNATPFGLTAGIATSSLKYATHFKRYAEAGMVMVNVPTAGVDYHVPFGGRKGSSYGAHEQGSYAAEFYTTVKTAYTSS